MGFNGDTEKLSPDQRFGRVVAHSPLPGKTHIASVLEEVFWSSLLTEEGRPCRPRLLYIPRDSIPGRQDESRRPLHQFETPTLLTRENLRKLSPAQGPLGYLIWDSLGGKPEIIGIQGRQGGDPTNFTIIAPGAGAFDVSWSVARLLTIRAGQLERHSRSALPRLSGALGLARQVTGGNEIIFLTAAIRAIEERGHGGALWILPPGRATEGLRIAHPVQGDPRPLPLTSQVARRFISASIGYLTGTDGAVVLDSQLIVRGFGAFIDLPAETPQVTSFGPDGKAKLIEFTSLGGGRHRSAMAFCTRFAPAAAFVVSEDGRVSVMWAETRKMGSFAPFSTLRNEWD